MRNMQRRAGATVLVASLVAWSGCGPGVPSEDRSTAEAKVTGTVKVHGKPMKGGNVWFDASDPARKGASSKQAKVNADGTFEVTTYVGHNSVRISGPAVKKEPMLSYTTQVIEVKPGDNKIDIDFPPSK